MRWLSISATFRCTKLGTPQSRGVKRHQQSAVVGSASCGDESHNFFLAQDGWQAKCFSGIGSFGDVPTLLESLEIEETAEPPDRS